LSIEAAGGGWVFGCGKSQYRLRKPWGENAPPLMIPSRSGAEAFSEAF